MGGVYLGVPASPLGAYAVNAFAALRERSPALPLAIRDVRFSRSGHEAHSHRRVAYALRFRLLAAILCMLATSCRRSDVEPDLLRTLARSTQHRLSVFDVPPRALTMRLRQTLKVGEIGIRGYSD